jgi:Alkylmercury lyase
VDARALEVRNLTYANFVEAGRAPMADEVARAAQLPATTVEDTWRELHCEHALVLDPATATIRMAAPFSAVPTPVRVNAAGRWWYGNCAWDAVGICAALHTDGRVETACPDCSASIVLEVRTQRILEGDNNLLFHCLVPAAQWWDDIGYT